MEKIYQRIKKPNTEISLPKGNVSFDAVLGSYYQDFTEAIHHYEGEYFGQFDEKGIPMFGYDEDAIYNQIYIIQYGLIAHDLILKNVDIELNKHRMEICVEWLENNVVEFEGTYIWRNDFPTKRFELLPGWVSSMYQGQIISLFLRYGQFTNQLDKYTQLSKKVFDYFYIPYEKGGVMRKDKEGNFWLEEYPSPTPSFVLNGFVYTLFGIIDLYRVSKDESVKKMMDDCFSTLKNSIHKYDAGYWSIYDQYLQERATKYYHKNIHIPLLEILYELTNESIFLKYKKKWEWQLNSTFCNSFVKIMYRVQPRIRRILN